MFSIAFPEHTSYKGLQTNFPKMVVSGQKKHTIRAGNRWKVEDKFSPRIWQGKPYRSPQMAFSQDITIKKIYDFEIKDFGFFINGQPCNPRVIDLVAKNDGLSLQAFIEWFDFPTPFKGQIICWDDKVNYDNIEELNKVLSETEYVSEFKTK